MEESPGRGVVGAHEKKMEDGLLEVLTVVGTVWEWSFLDVVQDFVEGDMACY